MVKINYFYIHIHTNTLMILSNNFKNFLNQYHASIKKEELYHYMLIIQLQYRYLYLFIMDHGNISILVSYYFLLISQHKYSHLQLQYYYISTLLEFSYPLITYNFIHYNIILHFNVSKIFNATIIQVDSSYLKQNPLLL